MWMSVIRLTKRPCQVLCWGWIFGQRACWRSSDHQLWFLPSKLHQKEPSQGRIFHIFCSRSECDHATTVQLTHSSTFVLLGRNETLNTAINDLVDQLFLWGDGLCRNYALQREQTGMLMCKPLVWFCINEKRNLYQKFSNKNAAWCQLNGWVCDLNGGRIQVIYL